MGYACPVCETPQRDAEHLANHLAFTAMLHGDAHESWLDDHAPDWAETGAADLAPVVADHAPETDYDEVFDDTVPRREGDHQHGHDHSHGHGPPTGSTPVGGVDPGDLDDDARRVLAEAREMTRAMLDGDEEEPDTDGKA